MKIRDLKNDKDIQMVYDANASIRGTIWYIVSCRETDNINEFLDKFEGTFHYENFVYGSEEPRVSMAGHGDIQQVIEIIEDLDEIDTYLPPEINLHKILELSNKFMNTDDSDEGIALSDDCLGQIFDEVENGFKRFWNRVESRNFLISSFKEFIELQADCIENILDKEIDDDFYIIEEEPQTPKMRKFKEASDEDFNKIWEKNPKFRDFVLDNFIKERNSYLRGEIFDKIEGAVVYVDVNEDTCIVEPYDSVKFIDSLNSIGELENYLDLANMIEEIKQDGYCITHDDEKNIKNELSGIVSANYILIQDDVEIKEHFAYMEQEEMIDDTFYYDDNFVLYRILSFA